MTRGITPRLVEKMKRLIAKYDGCLNETATRYCLIDPILRDLGWHLDDPRECEYEEGAAGRYDYRLGGRIIVEAKRLGGITARDERQLRDYLRGNGMRHGVLTDGRRWLKMIVGPDTYHEDFDVDMQANPYNVVVQRLQGLDKSVVFDMIEVAAAPAADAPPAQKERRPVTDPGGVVGRAGLVQRGAGAAAATTVDARRRFERIDVHKPSGGMPYVVQFDGVLLPPFANFSRAYRGVVEHLFERGLGLLTAESIRAHPLDVGGRGKTILLSAYRPPGKLERVHLTNGMWLNVNFSTAGKHRQMMRILKVAGCDPRRILVSSG